MNEQIRQYNDYLEACKEQHYQGKKKKKSKKSNSEEKVKPVKYSYKQLKSKGIIVSVDESLESVIKKLDFVISSKKVSFSYCPIFLIFSLSSPSSPFLLSLLLL